MGNNKSRVSIYQCKSCLIIRRSTLKPKGEKCKKQLFHNWHKLGLVGTKVYMCSSCTKVLYLNQLPKILNCTKGGFHKWTYLGEKGDKKYKCENCKVTAKLKSKPSSNNCSKGQNHNWKLIKSNAKSMSSKLSKRKLGIITIVMTISLSILGCGNESKKSQISEVEKPKEIVIAPVTNTIEIKDSYTRDSEDFFGVEALVFDGNTVRFSVASLYVQGQIVDRENIIGTYMASSNGNIITVELDFNTNFVFVDYLIDGSSSGGKSIQEVNVPYIITGSKTKDGHIILKGWENNKQKEERLKREEIEANKEEVVEDYGIDKDIILGQYKSSDDEKGVTVIITSIDELEVTKIRKKGTVTGIIKLKDMEKEFTSDYETGYNGDKYTFAVDYKDDRGRNRGVLFVFDNGFQANFYSDSGASKRFNLERIGLIEEVKEEKNVVATTKYYKINDPDGYTNLRDKPKGEVTKKVLENERFEVISAHGDYKKVKLSDGTIGYIHSSRVVEY